MVLITFNPFRMPYGLEGYPHAADEQSQPAAHGDNCQSSHDLAPLPVTHRPDKAWRNIRMLAKSRASSMSPAVLSVVTNSSSAEVRRLLCLTYLLDSACRKLDMLPMSRASSMSPTTITTMMKRSSGAHEVVGIWLPARVLTCWWAVNRGGGEERERERENYGRGQ